MKIRKKKVPVWLQISCLCLKTEYFMETILQNVNQARNCIPLVRAKEQYYEYYRGDKLFAIWLKRCFAAFLQGVTDHYSVYTLDCTNQPENNITLVLITSKAVEKKTIGINPEEAVTKSSF